MVVDLAVFFYIPFVYARGHCAFVFKFHRKGDLIGKRFFYAHCKAAYAGDISSEIDKRPFNARGFKIIRNPVCGIALCDRAQIDFFAAERNFAVLNFYAVIVNAFKSFGNLAPVGYHLLLKIPKLGHGAYRYIEFAVR